jgi:hypothetical protein
MSNWHHPSTGAMASHAPPYTKIKSAPHAAHERAHGTTTLARQGGVSKMKPPPPKPRPT